MAKAKEKKKKQRRKELKSFFSMGRGGAEMKRGDYFLNAIDFFPTPFAPRRPSRHHPRTFAKENVNPFLILASFFLITTRIQ